MSDHLPDTEYLGTPYCPTCYPERDPLTEILEVRYCGTHQPELGGAADGQVKTQSYMSGSAEAGGEDNAAWGHLVHRGVVVSPVPPEEVLGTGESPPVD